jgi:N-acetylmuramoyl-L-alanine amidase
VLTRDGDVLLYDKNSNYHGRKKIMDLTNRLKIANGTENPLFISIHMNSFAQTQYNGLQVWYSKNNTLSSEVAKDIQLTARTIQASNYRQEKEADSKIFLLDKLSCPAVLIECGFLSNESEAEKLSTEEYRQRLAFVIFSSTLKYVAKS